MTSLKKTHNAVIMPNHVHVLLEIDIKQDSTVLKIKSVSELIGAYKTTTSKLIHLLGNVDFKWQRSFHDHIVRAAKGYENIFQYISENPMRWKLDMHNDKPRTDRSRPVQIYFQSSNTIIHIRY